MAYISTEQVKSIRDQIKNAYPRYKWSITGRNSSTVVIALMESDLPFDNKHEQLNHYYLKESEVLDDKGKSIFQHVKDICNSVEKCYNRNADDIYADYGDSTYFISLNIGKWDKPHKIIPAIGVRHPCAIVGKVMTPVDIEEYHQECVRNQALVADSIPVSIPVVIPSNIIHSWKRGSMVITEEVIA